MVVKVGVVDAFLQLGRPAAFRVIHREIADESRTCIIRQTSCYLGMIYLSGIYLDQEFSTEIIKISMRFPNIMGLAKSGNVASDPPPRGGEKPHQRSVENAWPLTPIDPGTVAMVRGFRLRSCSALCVK